MLTHNLSTELMDNLCKTANDRRNGATDFHDVVNYVTCGSGIRPFRAGFQHIHFSKISKKNFGPLTERPH